MKDWTEGYIAEIGYLFEYFNELNPLRYRLAFLNQGIVLPEVSTACELGFGQGISVNIHSVASNVDWWGTDFNPSQAEFARSLGQESGKKIHLSDESFEDFCIRDDLPEFDFIAMHGIWTWISDKNRAIISDFIRRKLKVGGVFYISYNTQPGWAQFIPLRSILFEHTQVMSASGQGVVSRVDAAIEFTDRLFASNPAYSRINPSVLERFNKIKKQNRHYLAHEYFNKDWQPMLISELAKWMETAKVSYVCSAHLLRNLDFIDLTIEQQNILAEIHDPIFKETVRDYIINQQFRSDYWVKGLRIISEHERLEVIRKQRIILTAYRPNVSLSVKGFLGEATLMEEIYKPVLDVLGDYQIKTVEQIETILKPLGIDIGKIWQAIIVLAGKDVLAPVQEEALINEIKPKTDRFNLHILKSAIYNQTVNWIASPFTGAGYKLSRFEQLFLLAYLQNDKQPAEWASFVWEILKTQNQRLIKDGKPIETTEENLNELIRQAHDFAVIQLPVLKGLGILEIADN